MLPVDLVDRLEAKVAKLTFICTKNSQKVIFDKMDTTCPKNLTDCVYAGQGEMF